MPKLPTHNPGLRLSRDERERRQALQDPLLHRDPEWAAAQIDAVKTLDEAKVMLKRLLNMVRALEGRRRAG